MRSNRRSKKEIEDSILSALERLVLKHGFANVHLVSLINESKMDHNVFYRNFGSLDNAMEVLVKKYDFWISDQVNMNQIAELGDRKFMIKLFQTFYLKLEESEVMQKVLIWELEDTNPITRRSVNLRENLSMNLVSYLDSLFQGSKIDISSINSLIVSGIYYMVMHRNVSTFCGVDYSSESGRKRALKAIEDLLNMVFDNLEAHSKIASAVKAMDEDGVEHSKIAKYLGLTAASVRKILK